jgi:pilus assembly protein FimV
MSAKPAAQPEDSGLAGISLNLDDAETSSGQAPEIKDEHWHEVATKLDLAKAYQEMGDAVGAREILEDVLREGDEGQREAAQSLLNQIG